MFELKNVRFCFEGRYYVHCFSVSESHPEFEKVNRIAEDMKKYSTFKPIYLKEVNGKKFISIQLRGVTKWVALGDDEKGNTYNLKISGFEKEGSNGKLYLNLYCDGITLNTAKPKEAKTSDLGVSVKF